MRVRHLHFQETTSTMDTAREEARDSDFLLVTAESQTRGRGTRGRSWSSPEGNVYFTLAAHRRFLPGERLRLWPLESGLELWDAAAGFLPPHRRAGLRLKWPNDLLWEGRKAAGMLAESARDHLLVGVGVNVAAAPAVSDGGSPSACLVEAGADPACALPLARDFFQRVQDRLVRPAGSRDVLDQWKSKALWDVPFRLRDRAAQPLVTPVDLNPDGHLLVRFADGREEWLVSEYLA